MPDLDHDVRLQDNADRVGGANAVPVVIAVPGAHAVNLQPLHAEELPDSIKHTNQ